MSKRKSGSQANTLLNYFTSPKNKSNLEVNGNKSEKKIELNDATADSDDEPIAMCSKKRSRVNLIDSDSDHENIESVANTTPKSKRQINKRAKLESDSEESDEDSPIKKKKSSKATLKSFAFEKSDSPKPQASGTNGTNSNSTSSKPATVNEARWLHEKLDFLKPDKIRDANKRKADHPDYDSHTLYVPEDYLNKLTPAMRQWWILKSKHMDTVLFFKVGKFYELYHMDATVGVNHLGFSYMKGEFAHSGFPESAYGRMASSLIEQGFKIARVEQTETPEMMAERCKNKKVTKFDKVVNREICEVSTKGMCVYGAQLTDAKQALPCYMLAIAEKIKTDVSSRFGVCFIDTSIGIFHLAEFDDDLHCSKMLALLVQYPPALVLTKRNYLSARVLNILKRNLGNVRREFLSPESQFLSANTTIQKLMNACYFMDKNDEFHWPPVLTDLIADGSCKPEYELAISALGASMWYLKDSELDIKLLSMGKFKIYCPVNTSASKDDVFKRDYMVIDAITIQNLNLLGGAGSLQKTLDYCKTAFGKRLLQQWICRPLCDVHKILERQAAVKDLVNNTEKLQQVQDILKKLPDLERQIVKIDMFGNRLCAQYHPDSRAVLYEAQTYSKRKILDLLGALRGFERAQAITPMFKDCESKLLLKLTQHKPLGTFTDLHESLKYFQNAFDHNAAEKEGKIIPQAGIDEDYDQAQALIKKINDELEEYLEEQRKFFGSNKVVYFGNDKKRFQLEVPESRCHKVTNEYQMEGTRKGSKPCKRYSTATTKELLARMLKAEADRAKIIQDLNRRIFAQFSERYEEWINVIECLKLLDVLCSLAEYSKTYSHDMCVPQIQPFSQNPIIKIENGRHPCIINKENFVPNDTTIGTDECASILILTGPNMGGKSTLMRQVALISIMAQIGSYVPAASCELGVIDRIFTRLGAQDDILKHQSTFLAEMMEAATILQHATEYSFVLLDELGRGTSTHDGTAIATAYVHKLTEIKCRTIFSTHYHSLVDYFVGRNDIQLGHMACMVENEDDVAEERITFLYKLAEGACPKSYGFNVARLAGLPQKIIQHASEVARDLEAIATNRRILQKALTSNPSSIKELLISTK